MLKYSLHVAIVLLMVSLTPFGAAKAQIVDINSRANNLANPVEIFLDAGTYSVEPIGAEDGGAFNSWSAWSRTTCNDPERCLRTSPTTFTGWLNEYHVISPDITAVAVDGTELTPEDQDESRRPIFLVTPERTLYRAAAASWMPSARRLAMTA